MRINLKQHSLAPCGCSVWLGPIESPPEEQGAFLRTCGAPSECETAMGTIDAITEGWKEITVLRANKMDEADMERVQ